jgi:molecular chaperone DnaJ
MEISFMDTVNGAKKEVSYEKKATCVTCNGTQCKPGTAPTKCTGCGGRGNLGLLNSRHN